MNLEVFLERGNKVLGHLVVRPLRPAAGVADLSAFELGPSAALGEATKVPGDAR